MIKKLVHTCLLLVALPLFLTLAGCKGGQSGSDESAEKNPHLKTFTTANFTNEVLASKQPVLVDFWATWCGPCKIIAPSVAEIATEYNGKAVVGKLDVDKSPDIATEYQITGIPALLIFKDGKVFERILGVTPKDQIIAKLQAALASQ